MYKRYYDIDVDAKAYANNIVKAGGRIPSDIVSVSDFIRKLKQNNLYHNVADMWFLRRNQNSTAGSVLYGLKDLKNTCTLVNGPTIDNNGIKTLSASSQYLEIITPEILDNFTICMIGSNTVSNTTNNIFNFQRYRRIYSDDAVSLDFNGTSLRMFTRTSGVTTNVTPVDSSYGSNSFNFQGFAISHDVSSNLWRYRRGASIVTNTGTPRIKVLLKNRIYASTRDENGAGGFVATCNFIYSAFFLFSTNVDSNWNNIYNIYKTTAGKGLGLP
jgi:hypothetical protein